MLNEEISVTRARIQYMIVVVSKVIKVFSVCPRNWPSSNVSFQNELF